MKYILLANDTLRSYKIKLCIRLLLYICIEMYFSGRWYFLNFGKVNCKTKLTVFKRHQTCLLLRDVYLQLGNSPWNVVVKKNNNRDLEHQDTAGFFTIISWPWLKSVFNQSFSTRRPRFPSSANRSDLGPLLGVLSLARLSCLFTISIAACSSGILAVRRYDVTLLKVSPCNRPPLQGVPEQNLKPPEPNGAALQLTLTYELFTSDSGG